MVATIPKNTGYIVGATSGSGATVLDEKGYIVLAQSNAEVDKSGNYVVSVPTAAVPKQGAYVASSNPSSLTRAASYVAATSANLVAAINRSIGYATLYSEFPPYIDLVTEIGFVDRQFPTCVSFGSSGGPGFKTSVFEVDSGLTTTEIEWERIRSRYNANFDHVPPSDIEAVESFFYGMKGKAIAFRYKDWSDYTITNQNFMVGDGTTQTFQIFKRYTSGGFIFDRIIRKPIGSTAVITLNGVQLILNQDYFVNEGAGEIVFRTPPANNSLGTIVQLEYDVPVRFDTDILNVSFDDFRQLNISSLPMIEVLI